MDEPTGGLDVSVQARLLDLLRGLVADLGLAAIVVTHDLAVARLLSHRMMVMKDGRVIETGPDRPRARRSARALHAASRLLDLAGVTDAPRPSIVLRRRQELHHAPARRHRAAGRRRRVLRGRRRRMRRARRTLRRRQELDPEDALRQLCASMPAAILVEHDGEPVDLATASPRTVLAVRRDTIGYVSQFLRTVPRVSALDVVAEPLVAAASPRTRRAARRARTARPAQSAGAALVAAAGHLLRRRAAARQHRPRLHHRPSGAAARRADRLARCRQPRRGRSA